MKNRKLLSLIASVLVAATATLNAQTTPAPEAAPSYSFTLTPAFVSQYMFRGVRLGGPSFEPALEFDSGAYALGVWSNFPISDKVDGQSDPEFDFYGSYTFNVSEAASIVPGFTVYTYPNADTSNGFYKASFEPNVALNYSLGPVKLSPKIYYDLVLEGPTYEFTASLAIPLADAGTELDFVGTVGTFKWNTAAEDTTPDVKNWGDYYLIGVSMPFQVTKESKLTIGYAYTEGSNNYVKQGTAHKAKNTAAVGRGVFSVSYAWTF
ncbi:MAG TPA: TorF family putative porin [Opitutus sp.]|nr:TorF family putative porin [Opitutus sp.]